MNYYERYVGNYAKKTAHLSLVEHGAYNVMLDTYYATEAALPADLPALYRICRAMTKAEQVAVRAVADQFFPVGPDRLRHNEKADEIIAKALKRITAAKENGAKAAHKKPLDANPPGGPVGTPPGSDPPPQWDGQAEPGSPHMVKPPSTMHQATPLPKGEALSPNKPGEKPPPGTGLPGNLRPETWADWQRHLLQKGKQISEPQLRMQLATLHHVDDPDEHVRRCIRSGFVYIEPPGRTTATAPPKGNGKADKRTVFNEQVHGATKGQTDDRERDITGESERVD